MQTRRSANATPVAPYRHTPLCLALTGLMMALTQPAVADDAINLGTVTGSASAPATPQMFATPTPVNVEQTPAEQTRNIQLFNPDASQAQVNITAGALDALPPTASYTQALATLPNVVVQTGSDSMTGDNVYINGLPKTLINFTVDDMPLNDSDSYGFYTNEFVPPDLLSGIQYYSSAASAAIPGQAAFAGSVQAYTRDPGPDMFVEPLLGAGSFGKHNVGMLFNSGLMGSNTGAPTALWLYQNNVHMDGYFQNTPATQYQTLAKSVTQIGPATLTLFYSRNDETFSYYDGCTAAGLALYGNSCNLLGSNPYLTSGAPNTQYTGYNYNQYVDSTMYAKLDIPLAPGARITNQIYRYDGNGFGASATTYTQHLLQPVGGYGSVSPSANNVLLDHAYNTTQRWGDTLKLLLSDRTNTLEAGVWYNHNDSTHDNRYYNDATIGYVGSNYTEYVTTDTTEPYVNYTHHFSPALDVVVGAKYLYMTRSFDNVVAQAAGQPYSFDTNFNILLPSAGINYKLSHDWSVYANYTRNANPPAYNQFYTSTFNPNLAPEEADTWEAGTRWKINNWSSTLDAFRLNFSNYILSSTISNGGSGTLTELANAGSAVNQGISWQNNWLIDDHWSMYANLGWLHAHFDTLNQPFPYAPDYTASVGAIYQDQSWTGRIGAIRVDNAYYSVGGYPNNTLLTLPANTTVNASLSYRLRHAPMGDSFGFKDATLSLLVNNLTNTSYVTAYYNSTTMQMNQPRNYYVTLDARF